VAALPGTQALATASYAVAASAGISDDDMALETNLAAVQGISKVAKEYGLPLSVDWQDGYGKRLEEGVGKILDLGVVGVNLEDCDKDTQKMLPVEEASQRVKKILDIAKSRGISDFVVNARTDTLLHGGSISDAIERGKSYLASGATTVFVWGGSNRGGITEKEVVELTRAFDGKLNVALKLEPGNLTARDLAKIGVARMSIGPTLQFKAMRFLSEEAEKVLLGRN
jgi:2-methylisocitrate lyase-like PEP mutase family enzyme